MAGTDNILAGLEGLFGGISSVVTPVLTHRANAAYDAELERRRREQELQQQINFLPYKRADMLATKLGELAMEQPYKLEQLQAAHQPTTVLGRNGPPGSYPGKVEFLPEPPGEKNKLQLEVKEQQQQDKLEKDYRDLHLKQLAARSGGIGMQDQKVNQAIHLRSLLDQYYDPNTGQYNVPKSQYEELALGLANLVSGSNTATEGMRQGIMQRTAKGDIAGAIAYVTGSTPSASTQDVFKNLADSIDRQGVISEQLRDKYHQQMKSKAPTRLDQERKAQVEREAFGSSYKEYLSNSTTKQTSGMNQYTPAQLKKMQELGIEP